MSEDSNTHDYSLYGVVSGLFLYGSQPHASYLSMNHFWGTFFASDLDGQYDDFSLNVMKQQQEGYVYHLNW